MFQIEDRVVVPDGGAEHPGGVADGGRRRHLEAGRVGERRLEILRVERTGAHSAAGRAPERERHAVPGPVAAAGGEVGDHVEGAGGEVEELVLDDRTKALEGGAHRDAGEPLLADRRVEDPVRPERVEEPLGEAEGSTVASDVLAEEEHARIPLHLVAERPPDGREVGDHRDSYAASRLRGGHASSPTRSGGASVSRRPNRRANASATRSAGRRGPARARAT